MNITGNAYWSDSQFNILWIGQTFNTLSSFRNATTQETLKESPTGFYSNPFLTNTGNQTPITIADLLGTLTAYKPLSNSPLIGSGLDLSLFSISRGLKDFLGNSIHPNGTLDIGAIQFQSFSPTSLSTSSTVNTTSMTSPLVNEAGAKRMNWVGICVSLIVNSIMLSI